LSRIPFRSSFCDAPNRTVGYSSQHSFVCNGNRCQSRARDAGVSGRAAAIASALVSCSSSLGSPLVSRKDLSNHNGGHDTDHEQSRSRECNVFKHPAISETSQNSVKILYGQLDWRTTSEVPHFPEKSGPFDALDIQIDLLQTKRRPQLCCVGQGFCGSTFRSPDRQGYPNRPQMRFDREGNSCNGENRNAE
jgi:hypothetical protein